MKQTTAVGTGTRHEHSHAQRLLDRVPHRQTDCQLREFSRRMGRTILSGEIMNEASNNIEAWKAFRKHMTGKRYGDDEERQAWLWFLDGWHAKEYEYAQRANHERETRKL